MEILLLAPITEEYQHKKSITKVYLPHCLNWLVMLPWQIQLTHLVSGPGQHLVWRSTEQ